MKPAALLAGAALLIGTGVSAQQPPVAPSAGQMQAALERAFAGQADIRITNVRGNAGETGHWAMERSVTGAERVSLCTTRFLAPRLLRATNVSSPATFYTLSWNTVSDVLVEQNLVAWTAGHMATGEWARFALPTPAQAQAVGRQFSALATACGARLPAGTSSQATQQVSECAIAGTITPERIIAACNALLTSGQYPNTPENTSKIYAFRATAYLRQNNSIAALADANRAIAADPPRTLGYVIRGVTNARLDRHAAALADFETVLRTDAADPTALGGRTSALIGLRRYPDAGRAAAEFLRHHPDHAGANNLACWVDAAFLGRDLAAARRYCDTAIRLEPTEAAFLDSRGMVSLKQQRFADAWRDYDQAVRHKPAYAHALFGRGIAALRQGRTAQGNADLAAARRLDPDVENIYAEAGIRP